MEDRIRLGVSTCLLGERVRFDGGHKRDRFVTDILGQYVEYVPVCPEVECGLGVPREAMRLVGDSSRPRLVTVRTKKDLTDRMLDWASRRVEELEEEKLCGFVFKSKSPSSGMERVKVYRENGIPANDGVGLFARAFMERFPLIPVEEDGRLNDPKIRENFIEAIFTFKRWRENIQGKKSRSGLVDFHTRHKLLLLSHSQKHSSQMGKLVAQAADHPIDEVYDLYQTELLQTLRLKTSIKKQINVLHHIVGYFKKQLTADEKQELLEIIELYRKEHVPLIVPVTLLNHYVRKYDQPYLKIQYYLHPHPVELRLRNHA